MFAVDDAGDGPEGVDVPDTGSDFFFLNTFLINLVVISEKWRWLRDWLGVMGVS